MADSTRSARQRILATAADLFFREGYHAVGIDTIIERSGVAKMTLYRHFSSKNALIIAYLEQTNNDFWCWVEQAINEHPADPREQLVAIFEKLADLLTDPATCACAFQQATIEFPHIEHPIHQVAIQQREAIRACFCTLTAQAGAPQPDLLAEQLLLLLEGALMQGRLRGPTDLALPLLQSVNALIDAQLSAPTIPEHP